MSSAALPGQAGMPAAGASAAKPSKRAMAGLAGIFLAAMMAGLNNRVGALALADVRGALGLAWMTRLGLPPHIAPGN